jgi:hypothetical protein
MSMERRGQFDLGDIPLRILNCKWMDLAEKVFIFEIEWKEVNGFKPWNSFYTNRELKNNDPDLLCNFYDKRIKPKLLRINKHYSSIKRKFENKGGIKVYVDNEHKKSNNQEIYKEAIKINNKENRTNLSEILINYFYKNKPSSCTLNVERKRISLNYYIQAFKRTTKSFNISHVRSLNEFITLLDYVKDFIRYNKVTKRSFKKTIKK